MHYVLARLFLAGMLVFLLFNHSARAGSLDAWAGRWVGSGTVTISGSNEAVRCRQTVFALDNGTSMKLTLRCANQSINIEAVCSLKLTNGLISGSWEETKYNQSGTVSGTGTADAIMGDIIGQNFKATLHTKRTSQSQSISVKSQNWTFKAELVKG